ncbi:MAG: AraC family ligand binding domain-containing protein, partial [Chloroflexota bacterium]
MYPPRGTYGPRVQRDYQLVLLHRGEVDVNIHEEPHHLAAGEVALLKPGHREYFQFARETESHHSWLAITRPPLPPPELAALDTAPFALPISPAMANLMAAGLAARQTLAAPQVALVPLVTTALALYVAEARAQGVAGHAPREHPAVASARALVRSRLHERITLPDLATAAHVA